MLLILIGLTNVDFGKKENSECSQAISRRNIIGVNLILVSFNLKHNVVSVMLF